MTKHHIVPKSKGGLNTQDNIVKLKRNVHQALHTVFHNQMFTEKLKTLAWMERAALSPDYISEILDMADTEDRFVYKKGIYIKK